MKIKIILMIVTISGLIVYIGVEKFVWAPLPSRKDQKKILRNDPKESIQKSFSAGSSAQNFTMNEGIKKSASIEARFNYFHSLFENQNESTENLANVLSILNLARVNGRPEQQIVKYQIESLRSHPKESLVAIDEALTNIDTKIYNYETLYLTQFQMTLDTDSELKINSFKKRTALLSQYPNLFVHVLKNFVAGQETDTLLGLRKHVQSSVSNPRLKNRLLAIIDNPG